MDRRSSFLWAFLIMTLMGLATSRTAMAQPAPPLTSLTVVAVGSQSYPYWDYINGAYITPHDHGGGWVEIATREIGYGQNRIAKFNGVRLTESRPAEKIVSGGTIVGYIRYWAYKRQFTSGTFTYQSTSMNSPWNTMSTWVNVK